ncbi:MAG: MFS transporter [Rhodoluna sp.]|nr:MFS transporter [Rhodoluna sp.]
MIKTLKELGSVPHFYQFFAARTISNFGNGISPVALAFGVLGIAGADAGSLSLVQGARTLPILLLLIVGGTIADKYGRAKVMGLTDMWLSVLILIAAWSFISGSPSVWLLTIVGLLAGILNGVWYPAFAGLTPILVPEEKLQGANAAIGFGSNVAFMFGTVSGGIVVLYFGVGWALAVDAITFLIAGALVYPLSKLPQPGQAERGEKVRFFRELKLGWDEFKSRSWLVTIVIAFGFINMTFEAIWAVLGALKSLENYDGAATWGLVLGFMSIGFLLGTVIANRARPKYPLRMVMIVMLAEPLFTLAFGTSQPIIAVLITATLFGIALDLFYVVWSTTIQQNVPSESLSRVNSYDSFGSFVLGPLGIIIAGPLAVAIGIETTMVIGASISLLAIVGALMVPGVRNLQAKFND